MEMAAKKTIKINIKANFLRGNEMGKVPYASLMETHMLVNLKTDRYMAMVNTDIPTDKVLMGILSMVESYPRRAWRHQLLHLITKCLKIIGKLLIRHLIGSFTFKRTVINIKKLNLLKSKKNGLNLKAN
jgi:hypothetical protein